MIVNACESENLTAISAAVEEARSQHPSLLRKLTGSTATGGAGSRR